MSVMFILIAAVVAIGVVATGAAIVILTLVFRNNKDGE